MSPLPRTWLATAAIVLLLLGGLYLGTAPFLLIVAAGTILVAVLQLYLASTELTSALVTDGLVSGAPIDAPDVSSDIAAPRLRRELAITGLHEIAQEHELGKISDDDYRVIEGTYRNEARRLVQDEDAVLGEARRRAEEFLNSRRRAERASKPTQSRPSPSDASAAAPRTDTKCAQCHVDNDADARFCKHCGTSLLSP